MQQVDETDKRKKKRCEFLLIGLPAELFKISVPVLHVSSDTMFLSFYIFHIYLLLVILVLCLILIMSISGHVSAARKTVTFDVFVAAVIAILYFLSLALLFILYCTRPTAVQQLKYFTRAFVNCKPILDVVRVACLLWSCCYPRNAMGHCCNSPKFD